MGNAYLQEAFKALDILHEEDFNMASQEDMSELKDFIDNDEKEITFVDIIDDEAINADDLKDNYIGDIIVDCEVCHTKFYKKPDEIEIDNETGLVNIDEECPYCYSTEGYTIIGEVAPYEETDKKEDNDKEEEIEIDDEEIEEGFPIAGALAAADIGLNLGKAIKSKLSELYEAEMSDEDKRDSEILRNIYNKTQKRANARLTDDELAVLDKYGLTRSSDYKDIRKYQKDSNSPFGVPLINREIKRDRDKEFNNKKVNLADRARKIDDRGSGYKDTLKYNYSTPDDDHREYKDPETGRYKRLKGKGLLDDERRKENSDMYNNVFRMKDALSDKKYHNKKLDKIDATYDAERAQLQKKIDELEKRREWSKEYHKNSVDGSNKEIDRLLKRDTDECLTESADISKYQKWVDFDMEKYGKISAVTMRNIRKAGFSVVKDQYGEYEVIANRKDESCDKKIKEHFEKVEIETDTEKMEMSSDDKGKVVITTEPKNDEEMIVPPSIEIQSEINTVNDEEDSIVDVDIDEFSEEEFDELGESYLKRVYENVNSFKTSSVKLNKDNLIVEGIIGFKSGKNKKTSFVFESKDITKKGKVRFIGENLQLSKGKKCFTLKGSIDNNKFIAESLNYNYRAKDSKGLSTRLYGTVTTKNN